ncbi:hypothetical protein E9Q_09905 [Moraxella catarrhalis BC1]|nr:hypothetical protein E9Q_09905 [Moraxella catarrhalis BC1]EGE21236.1 hypothetical protein E9S_05847 [Moraxella catarrhalis BC7]EGE23171.1 hypothetical protein E9W_07121 [Moraxella catarrhalis CO72]
MANITHLIQPIAKLNLLGDCYFYSPNKTIISHQKLIKKQLPFVLLFYD